MAAFWALANNLIEIRTDAFKLCRTFRRPFARPAASIGIWEVTFSLLLSSLQLGAWSPRGGASDW